MVLPHKGRRNFEKKVAYWLNYFTIPVNIQLLLFNAGLTFSNDFLIDWIVSFLYYQRQSKRARRNWTKSESNQSKSKIQIPLLKHILVSNLLLFGYYPALLPLLPLIACLVLLNTKSPNLLKLYNPSFLLSKVDSYRIDSTDILSELRFERELHLNTVIVHDNHQHALTQLYLLQRSTRVSGLFSLTNLEFSRLNY